MTFALRVLNDEAEGDPPLQPFSDSLEGILIWSLILCLPFAVKAFYSNWKAGRKAATDQSPANP